jgi:hypothetical protein
LGRGYARGGGAGGASETAAARVSIGIKTEALKKGSGKVTAGARTARGAAAVIVAESSFPPQLRSMHPPASEVVPIAQHAMLPPIGQLHEGVERKIDREPAKLRTITRILATHFIARSIARRPRVFSQRSERNRIVRLTAPMLG